MPLLINFIDFYFLTIPLMGVIYPEALPVFQPVPCFWSAPGQNQVPGDPRKLLIPLRFSSRN